MTQREADVDEWFKAHLTYHKAVATYNERLALVRAERERGNWGMDVQAEYAVMHDAQSAALRASEALYRALGQTGETK